MNNKILYVTKDDANIIKRNAIENENVFLQKYMGIELVQKKIM